MIEQKPTNARPGAGTVIQFSVTGLMVFSVALVFAGGLLVYVFATARSGRGPAARAGAAQELSPARRGETPPWGELVTYDIQLEQPEEYLAFELDHTQQPSWTFEGMTSNAVRTFMASCGLPANQIDRALSPNSAVCEASNVVIKPDVDLVFSLSPGARAGLYHRLAASPANQYIRFPFCYPGKSFDDYFNGSSLDSSIVSMAKTLLYPRGDVQCFSDYEVMLQRIPTPPARLHFLQALSRQSAVLARLRVGPQTDIDKILGYWSGPSGLHFKDVRPLLESLRRRPEGGTISLLYLLPQFARQRLYTFPVPGNPGDPAMDCHWSTMNFFNEVPDNHFADPLYTVQYLANNYYRIAKPNVYGDVIFFLDENGSSIHSAVYLADDIVFTKNGNNFAQPWMLMRLEDLVARYESGSPSRVAFYRNNKM